jgi:two-component system sensor histidine kinase KdpD
LLGSLEHESSFCGSRLKKSILYNQAVHQQDDAVARQRNAATGLSGAQLRTWGYRYALAIGTIAVVVVAYRHLPANPTTVALTFLLVVLGLASRWGLTIATASALIATLAFNFYFLPPIKTFTISDPQNWIALFAFLVTAIVASRLSERARREAENANRRRKEVERLYLLSQQLLATDNVMELLNSIPQYVSEAFGLTAAAMYLPKRNEVYRTGVDHPELSLERLESVSGRGELVVDEAQQLCFVPLRVGVRPVGSLGLEGAVLSRETLEAVGSLVAISIERAGAIETLTRTEATRESEKLRSALLDSVTHEFRTPLTAIKLSVTTLLSPDPMSPEARQELLTIINEETDRLNRLVGEAAEMAQLDAQQVELRREPHYVADIVESALQRSKKILDGHEVRLHIPSSLPVVRVDLDRIVEVIAQLLENAAKYSLRGNPITISAESSGKMVNISVADQGPGIEDLEQSLIFEKFYRGRDQRYRVQGTGMGLAIAKAIVEAHGGSIGVTSQTGSGSVFHFTVPAEV